MNEFDNNTDYSNMSTREYMNAIASQTEGSSYNYYEASEQTENLKCSNSTSDANTNSGNKTGEKKKKGRANKYFKRAVALVAGAAVFGGVAGGVFNMVAGDTLRNGNPDGSGTSTIEQVADTFSDELNGSKDDSGIVIPTTSVEDDGDNNSQSLDVSDIAEGVMPSVVSITIKAVTEVNQGFFGGSYQYEAEGSGSGIIIGKNDTELLIVTNNHVVSGAETVSVSFIDNEVYEAKVKGADSDSDLAIIVVDLDDISEDTLSQIKIASLGNSDELKVGEQVIAIGNALGYGQSVTTGIVSAKDRTNTTNTTPLIQTDAAINPGNSGGALLNMQGEVIGINSSKYASTDVEGMGYAIPISQVESILDTLMNRETREKVDAEKAGYLGISCSTISQDVAAAYGIPAGALVSDVYDGSGAKKAGIKKNYIITKLDGQSVSSAETLIDMLEYYAVGEEVDVTVEYLQDDEYVEKTVTVVLGEKPQESIER